MAGASRSQGPDASLRLLGPHPNRSSGALDDRAVLPTPVAKRSPRTGSPPPAGAAFHRRAAGLKQPPTSPSRKIHDPFQPSRAPANLRDHLPPGRRQDDADRKDAALRRRDPARRRSARQGQPSPDPFRLDGHRARARHLGRHLGDDLRIRRLRLQPARHAGPRGLFRGHLPHADRGRFGGDGDRRRQGHRGAHPQAVRGLPAARHPDRHLHQQDGPRDARSVRPARRDREDAGARHRAARLDGRARPRARRRLRHSPQDVARARQGRGRDAGLGSRRPGDLGDAARTRARRGDGGNDARGRRLPPLRQAGVPRGASDAGAVRQRAEGIRRAQPDRRDGRIRAAAARAGSLDPHGAGGRSRR